MVKRWRAGVDVAYGARLDRDGESSFKKITAKLFYRLINRLSDVAIPLDTGDFRLMDRRVVDAFIEMPERDRFVRGMVAWVGFRQEPIYYHRMPRFAGETKYPLKKMLRLASDGILSVFVGAASAGGPFRLRFGLSGDSRDRLCNRTATVHRQMGDRLDALIHRNVVLRRSPDDVSGRHGRIHRPYLQRDQAPASISGQGTPGFPVGGA